MSKFSPTLTRQLWGTATLRTFFLTLTLQLKISKGLVNPPIGYKTSFATHMTERESADKTSKQEAGDVARLTATVAAELSLSKSTIVMLTKERDDLRKKGSAVLELEEALVVNRAAAEAGRVAVIELGTAALRITELNALYHDEQFRRKKASFFISVRLTQDRVLRSAFLHFATAICAVLEYARRHKRQNSSICACSPYIVCGGKSWVQVYS